MEQRPRTVLNEVKKGEICAILAVGCSRSTAARYVGCHVDTIRRTALREPEFHRALRQAESKHEVLHLSYINKAAKEGRYWRAAAWALERKYPGRYGQRNPKMLSIEQVSQVLSQFAGVILDEVPVEADRQRILARLHDLTASLQAAATRGKGARMNARLALDRCGLPTSTWAALAQGLKADVARRLRRADRPDSLLDWGRQYLPGHFRRQPSAMHRWLAERFDAMRFERGTKLNVIGPRGGAKSTLATLASVLRAAVEGWEPYIWIVSDTRQQAHRHLENLRLELTENAALAEDYPRSTGRGEVWRGGAIRLRNGVTIEAFGTGQRIRGRRAGPDRPTLILCDDLQNDSHTQSALQRENSRNWFQSTLLKAGTKHTNVVNLATALHRDALALELHRTPGWTSRVFKAIERWPDQMSLWHQWEAIYCDVNAGAGPAAARAFYDQHRAALDAGAELLWPDEEDLYTLMRMRVEGGRTAFEREKQGTPLNPAACEWPETYFDEQIWFNEWPTAVQVKVVALDPSKGRDARRSDYSAYVTPAVDLAGTLYVEADLARRATSEMVATGVEICRLAQPHAFGVETNQFQDLLAGEFEEAFQAQGLINLQPWCIDNRVNKQVRIRRLGPYLAGRRLRFKSGSPGTRLLVEQLQEFPAADHDDGPDALEMAIRLAGDLLGRTGAGDSLGDRLPIGVP